MGNNCLDGRSCRPPKNEDSSTSSDYFSQIFFLMKLLNNSRLARRDVLYRCRGPH
jgi:hypothetical protein